jgi:hypothetical protein
MDKKHHQRRQKTPTPEELADVSARGASFSTEAGRAAQGMRPDIGKDPRAPRRRPEPARDEPPEKQS